MAAIVIAKQRNGGRTSTRPTVVTLALEKSGDISVLIDAPFHNDMAPPVPAGRYPDLVNYELTQVLIGIGEFPTSSNNSSVIDYSHVQYLELGLGPYGHWYARMFIGESNFASCDTELNFPSPTVLINSKEDSWNGEIRIPVSFVPEPEYLASQSSLKWMINAFASHGGNNPKCPEREHLALSPILQNESNMHQLQYFVPIILQAGVTSADAIIRPTRARGDTYVNLDDADDDSVSEYGSDEENAEDIRDSLKEAHAEQENMRLYRILSGIAEERETEFTNVYLPNPPSKTNIQDNVPVLRVPSKDWYSVNREIDPNAPPTLASYTNQYRHTVKLDSNFNRYMNDDEFALLCATVWKRKGWSHKERVLILTSKPRLIYLDEVGKYKGTIPWTTFDQISATKLSSTQFDISTNVSKRIYHFNDKETGAEKWTTMINEMVSVWTTYIDYEKNKRANKAPPPVTQSVSSDNVADGTRNRSNSSLTGASNTNTNTPSTPNSGGHLTTPPTSVNSITAVPPTISEILEKYRATSVTTLLAASTISTKQLSTVDHRDGKLSQKDEVLFGKYIHSDEFVVMQGYVHKQQGFLPKRRVLILTSKPRLLYLKRDGTFVGTIAWSMTTPIIVKKVSEHDFDITESLGKVVYHFADQRVGSDRWVRVLKEICDTWSAYLKWQVGKVKAVTPQVHVRK